MGNDQVALFRPVHRRPLGQSAADRQALLEVLLRLGQVSQCLLCLAKLVRGNPQVALRCTVRRIGFGQPECDLMRLLALLGEIGAAQHCEHIAELIVRDKL